MIDFFSKLRDNRIFQFTVVIIIILNAVLIGATTYELEPLFLNFIHLLDYAITIFFVIEILIRFIGEKEKKNFFKDGWNIFDTIIVAISLIPIPNNSSYLVLRLLRIFRVLRLISVPILIFSVLWYMSAIVLFSISNPVVKYSAVE